MWEFKQIKNYLRTVEPRNLFIEAPPDSPLREGGKSLKFIKDLKGVRLNEGL